jgi:hypothetical protein
VVLFWLRPVFSLAGACKALKIVGMRPRLTFSPALALLLAGSALFLTVDTSAQPSGHSQDAKLARQVFGPFVGNWVGEFTLSLGGTGASRSFACEQRYWWDGPVLKGLSVYEENGETTYARSVNFVKDGTLFSDIEQGGERRSYRGQYLEGVVIWFPLDPSAAMNRQIKEKVTNNSSGEKVLLTEGFERIRRDGENLMIVYRGSLRLEKG